MFEGTETIPQDMQKSLNFAVDVADEIMSQSLDFAKNEYLLNEIRSLEFAQDTTSNPVREIIQLALGHAQIATSLLIAREKTDALTFALETLASAVGDVALALNSGKDSGAALFDISHTFSELLVVMRGGAADTRTKRAPLPKITRRKA